MNSVIEKTYGTWQSSISESLVAGKTPRISEPRLGSNQASEADPHNLEHSIFWLQTLPQEKGRTTIMKQRVLSTGATQKPISLIKRPLSVQSKAHEYGGGAYCLAGNTLFFVLSEDQRIYRLNIDAQDRYTYEPEPVTIKTEGHLRFADLFYDSTHHCLLAVCENHREDKEAISSIACISLSDKNPSTNTTILKLPKADFYSNPSISPCGNYLSYLCWHHPNMPWDATELWIANIDSNATKTIVIDNALCVKGKHKAQSIFQPRWSPSSDLFCVSDITNWWNIKSLNNRNLQNEHAETLWRDITDLNAEFATPQWVFGMSTYDFLNDDSIFCTYTQHGDWKAAIVSKIKTDKPRLTSIDSLNNQFSEFSAIACSAVKNKSVQKTSSVFIAANAAQLPSVYLYKDHDIYSDGIKLGQTDLHIDTQDISIPQSFTFLTGRDSNKDERAFGFYYAPTHRDFVSCDKNIKPCVIVLCHGGPTGATSTSFNPKIQYWTSRGFAVLDINYRGSTGFGRQYRHSLNGLWGIADVEDICMAKEHAIKQGWVANNKSIVKGSSAGGYTTLAALTFTQAFDAGVSLYGIGDLETLATDTHKFESRYLDSLIGPYPQEKNTYKSRSPIHFCKNISCPVLIFQGMKDKVVPPNQAKKMVEQLRQNNVPVTYITFENEGHGFRDAKNIETMLKAELRFYQQVFNLGSS